MNYFGEINLSKIPRELIRTVQTKQGVCKFLNICIDEYREPMYGSTHAIKAWCKAEQRRQDVDKSYYYIGSAKPSLVRGQSTQQQSAHTAPPEAQQATMPPTDAERATAYLNAATATAPQQPKQPEINFNQPQDDGLPF